MRIFLGIFSGFFFWANVLFSQNSIAFYRFNNNLFDYSGKSNHGVGFGDYSFGTDRFGNSCSALELNGLNAFVEVANSQLLNAVTQKFSVTCWFKVNSSASNNSRWLTIVCKGDQHIETPDNPQFRLQTFQGLNQSTISINTDFTKNDFDFRNHTIDFDKWYFYCLVYDGSFVKVYLNDKMVFSYPYSKALAANSSSLFIGKDVPGSTEFFNGSIDDLRIFDFALNEGQVLSLFHSNDVGEPQETGFVKCPPNLFYNTSESTCGRKVFFSPPVADLNCVLLDLKQVKGLPSGSEFQLGVHTLEFRGVTKSNEVFTCVSRVVITDSIAPKWIGVKDTVVYVKKGAAATLVSYDIPKLVDNCKVKRVWLDSGIESGKSFPIGKTKLVYKGIDESGNISACFFKVEVKEEPTRPEEPSTLSETIRYLKKDTAVLNNKPVLVDNAVGKIYYEHQAIYFDSCKVTIQIYDGEEEDGDSISVFFNGVEIQTKQMIKLKSHETIVRVLNLVYGAENRLVFKAWNTGRVGLNTMEVEFFAGDYSSKRIFLKSGKPSANKSFTSRPGLSSAIILKCR